MAFLQVTTQRQTISGIDSPRRSSSPWGDNRHRTLTSRQKRTKRVFDVVVSLLLICLVLPLMMLIALLLYLEHSGPVFQRQVKVGAGGLLFSAYQFRTHSRDTSRHPSSHLEHFLANSCIDRLPMLINVLRGHMSLVGPDLLTYAPGLKLTDTRRADLRMPPGLYHVCDKRAYLEHYSLWSDVRVLLQIISAALK